MKKPNVLFLLVDALRADKSVSPELRHRLPNIRRLVDNGVTFDTMISVASYTLVCVSSMFTGLYPVSHRVRMMGANRLPSWCNTLAEVFKKAGYNTRGHFAGPLEDFVGFDRGFDFYKMRKEEEEHVYNDWGDRLIKEIKESDDKPWFSYVHFWEVHQPRRVLPEKNSKEHGDTLYERAVSSWDVALGRILDSIPENTLVILTGDHGEHIGGSKLDNAIDRFKTPIRNSLKKIGLGEKSLKKISQARVQLMRKMFKMGVIDSPEATLVGHGHHVYDNLVRIPFVMMNPEILPKGKRISQQVSQVDIMPTLLDLLGLSNPKHKFDGRSLVPLIRGDKMEDIPVYMEAGVFDNPEDKRKGKVRMGSVRHKDYKYVYGVNDDNIQEEMYEITQDPNEKNNIALDALDKKRELQALCDKHFAKDDEKIGDKDNKELTKEEADDLHDRLKDLGYMM